MALVKYRRYWFKRCELIWVRWRLVKLKNALFLLTLFGTRTLAAHRYGQIAVIDLKRQTARSG